MLTSSAVSKTVDQPIQAQQSQSVLHESEPKPEPEPASVVEDKSFNKTAIKNGALTATPAGAVLIIVSLIVMLLKKD